MAKSVCSLLIVIESVLGIVCPVGAHCSVCECPDQSGLTKAFIAKNILYMYILLGGLAELYMYMYCKYM